MIKVTQQGGKKETFDDVFEALLGEQQNTAQYNGRFSLYQQKEVASSEIIDSLNELLGRVEEDVVAVGMIQKVIKKLQNREEGLLLDTEMQQQLKKAVVKCNP